MKILKLTIDNIMRVSAVEITPTGDVVVIGGRNAQGKTSVLSAIEMALGGKGVAVPQPVRKGEEKGRIVVDLGEIQVERLFKASGATTLIVRAANGAVFPSPQAMLNALVGKLTFDPLEFARGDGPAQAATLRALAGLDTSDLDRRRADVFARRTVVNADVARARANAAAIPEPPQGVEVPENEPDLSALVAQIDSLDCRNEDRRVAIRRAAAERERVGMASHSVSDYEEEVRRAEAALRAAQHELSVQKKRLESIWTTVREADAEAERAQAAMEDPTPLKQRIASWQTLAELSRAQKQKRRITADHARFAAAAEALTAELASIDAEKHARVAAARFPVPGLGVTDEGVTFGGLPFEQASAAEQLRASVAIGLALNPRLKVMIVRDGSLLDDDGLAILGELARQADAQIWVERVGHGRECSFVIEDGALLPEPLAAIEK